MENEIKELNMDEKIEVKNLAGWTVGFARKETIGDVTIPENGSVRLSRSEIISQIQNNNKLFLGIDGKGSHATIYIMDKDTRVEVDFESSDGKRTQQILTEDVVKKMFESKTVKTFESQLNENVITRAEKYAFMALIKKLKLNDYDKIKTAENYCRYKVDNIG
jgi:hypothetical protein